SSPGPEALRKEARMERRDSCQSSIYRSLRSRLGKTRVPVTTRACHEATVWSGALKAHAQAELHVARLIRMRIAEVAEGGSSQARGKASEQVAVGHVERRAAEFEHPALFTE